MARRQAHLYVKDFGPVQEARLELGDVTVFVGPQATGKSIILALFKLLQDTRAVQWLLKHYNLDWDDKPDRFFELFFGEGMGGLWQPETHIAYNGVRYTVEDVAKPKRGGRKTPQEKVFYIPAQRVLTLRDGLTRPFTDYRVGDPFVVRRFSDMLHQLVQSEFARQEQLFPQLRRLKRVFRERLEEHIYRGFALRADRQWMQRRLVLEAEGQKLPYMVWSAGQREFTPLLLGLYWLMPPGGQSRRKGWEWVVVEEPEMGLHPYAIREVTLLLLELARRGYGLLLSTHSPVVLDVLWAIRVFQQVAPKNRDLALEGVLELGGWSRRPSLMKLAESLLHLALKVYYFSPQGIVRDISALAPDHEEAEMWGWGGLTEFSGRVADLVGRVLARVEEAYEPIL